MNIVASPSIYPYRWYLHALSIHSSQKTVLPTSVFVVVDSNNIALLNFVCSHLYRSGFASLLPLFRFSILFTSLCCLVLSPFFFIFSCRDFVVVVFVSSSSRPRLCRRGAVASCSPGSSGRCLSRKVVVASCSSRPRLSKFTTLP